MTATLSLRSASRAEQRTLAFLLAGLMVEVLFFVVLAPLLGDYASRLHLSKLGAGILSASYSIGCGAAAIPAGTAATRFGARAVTIGGLVLVACACAAFAVGNQVVLLDAARAVQGVGGAALWAGSIGWLMALGTPADRGRLIGYAFSAAGVGACIGPAIGALATAVGAEAVFLTLAVSILALAAFGFAGLRAAGGGRSAQLPGESVRVALMAPASRRALAMVALPSLGLGAAGVLVPLRLHHLGVTAAVIAAAFVLASVVETVTNPIVGRWYDRRGGRLVLRATLLASLACAAVLALGLPAVPLLIWLVVTWPVIVAVWIPALAELTDAVATAGGSAGLALGLFNFCWAICQSVGAAGGAQLSRASEAAPYLVLVALYGAGVYVGSRPVQQRADPGCLRS